ncbi:unnamed protein product, partial [marine sediment metagenome]
TFTKNTKRKEFYLFSDPISTVKDVFYKIKHRNITWDTFDNLKNYSVGYSQGYNYDPVFLEAIKMKKFIAKAFVPLGTAELTHLKRLILGRTDLIICEVSLCQYLIKTNTPEFHNVDFINNPIGKVRTFHIGFSKKWKGVVPLVKQFNMELTKFVAEGKRKQIFKKYGIISDLE